MDEELGRRDEGPVDINKYYNGSTHLLRGSLFHRYTNPLLKHVGKREPDLSKAPQYFHRDILKRVTHKPQDLDRYISQTSGKSFRMVVQAAPNTQEAGAWRRVKVKGNAATLLKVASWAVGFREGRIPLEDVPLIIGKSILVLPAILFLVAYPMGNAINSTPTYPAFPNRCYEYPKHALNRLDAAPNTDPDVVIVQEDGTRDVYKVVGEQNRLLRPRALMVYRNNEWECVEDGSYKGLYIFISFAAELFKVDIKPAPKPTPENLKPVMKKWTKQSEECLNTRARRLAEELGVEAYWIDYECRSETQPGLTDDVHRFCDVVRGAHQVCVLLPDRLQTSLVFFGSRLWCLPEILLARNHKVMLCTPGFPGQRDSTELVDIMEMTHRAWALRITKDNEIVSDGNEEIFRLLAEHYTGTLTLSRLELIQVALEALGSRGVKKFQTGDLAYALMTLLKIRPRMDPTDSEQQALARLSLANDSDHIVERMACMDQLRFPKMERKFNISDDLGAKLWDIEPLCQVAGVCKDGSIILDGCHGISIRWKNIPRIHFVNRESWKKALAGFSLRSGPFWFLLGAILVALQFTAAIGAFFLVIGILLLITAPFSVTTLYGGKIWGAKPWLIGFEGTLPIHEIERRTFGNAIGRLMYTPSSGPYCLGRANERIGKDPQEKFNEPGFKLPKGHRLFTLIDTGTMTVTVFAAERPPSVALFCGKEGGMLRAVLCSYERSTNTLKKECVLRMETPMWDQSIVMGWVKLSSDFFNFPETPKEPDQVDA